MQHNHAEAIKNQSPKDFWESRYSQTMDRGRGKMGFFLKQTLAGIRPGRVLELGCSTGDDALWLAEQGWEVTAVDISENAIQTAQRLAQEAGLAKHIHFMACDLEFTIPVGAYDLVCALYFQSPYPTFPRIEILKRAATQLKPGGHLLVITHASGPPWAEHSGPKPEFPKVEDDWRALGLSPSHWQLRECRVLTRKATGPQGQEADLQDNLILVERIVSEV